MGEEEAAARLLRQCLAQLAADVGDYSERFRRGQNYLAETVP
jgi:hypothetical protein